MPRITPLEYPLSIKGQTPAASVFWWGVAACLNVEIWYIVLRVLATAVRAGWRG
jgi:hypothetical protein